MLWSGAAMAQDYVIVSGLLSDEDFYRLVACGAAPDGPCRDPMVRWPADVARDLRVSFQQIEPNYPGDRQTALEKAFYAAITEINASGANLRLRVVAPNDAAEISVHLLDIAHGEQIARTGLSPLDGAVIEAALVQVWWNRDLMLDRAAIVFPRDIEWSGLRSIALEELTQALGLLTDIDGRWYERTSIFSESSNAVIRLGAQDIMALRRHYPPE